jgi:acetyltransferase-like isoleucine patch superfamily enzyme
MINMVNKQWAIKGPLSLNDGNWGELFENAANITYELNNLHPSEETKKQELLKELFGKIGEGTTVMLPFYCNTGVKTIIGKNTFINNNCNFLDTDIIEIGDNTLLGPGVNVLTADHPVSTRERILPVDDDLEDENYSYIDEKGNFDDSIEYTFVNTRKPVKIGDRCWIGANSIILPGVTIGNNVVIGAGSVVTKDIPDNVVAVGSPAKIIRENK